MDKQQDEFPRRVLVQQTLDVAIAEMGDYDETEGADLRLGRAIGESRHLIELESWEAIPAGHELISRSDRKAYAAHLVAQGREEEAEDAWSEKRLDTLVRAAMNPQLSTRGSRAELKYEGSLARFPSNAGKTTKQLLAAAQAGDPEAQFDLGVCYATGNGVPCDKTAAANWLLLAEGQGLEEAERACSFLEKETEREPFSFRLENDRWIRSEPTSKMERTVLRAQLGESAALSSLGNCYANGMGAPEDLVVAYCLLSLAADDGEPERISTRDCIGQELVPEQIVEAKGMAERWRAGYPKRVG